MEFFAGSGSENGIPQRCTCGGQAGTYIGTYIGKKYFVCKDFENDGLHRKKEWDEAIEEETKRLKRKFDEQECKILRLNSIEFRVSSLEEDELKNAEEIEELKYFLKNRYPNDFYPL